eukprot:PRCOL_00000281-RA
MAQKRHTPLLDEVHVCVLLALIADETTAERATWPYDIAKLDNITWPTYMWYYLSTFGEGLQTSGVSIRDTLPADEEVPVPGRRLPASLLPKAAHTPKKARGKAAAKESAPPTVERLSREERTRQRAEAREREAREAAEASVPLAEAQAPAVAASSMERAQTEPPIIAAFAATGWAGSAGAPVCGNGSSSDADEDREDVRVSTTSVAFDVAPKRRKPGSCPWRWERPAGPGRQREMVEYCTLSAKVKAGLLVRLCDELIETSNIRTELERREVLQGDWGTERRWQKGAAAVALGNGDHNYDACVLCGGGGNLVCCEGCPAAFHMKCAGLSHWDLRRDDWTCSECSLYGHGSGKAWRGPRLPTLYGRASGGLPAWRAPGCLFVAASHPRRNEAPAMLAFADAAEPLAAQALGLPEIGREHAHPAPQSSPAKTKTPVCNMAVLAQASVSEIGGLPLAGAEEYTNTYRNAWWYVSAHMTTGQRGKQPDKGRFAISKFSWPNKIAGATGRAGAAVALLLKPGQPLQRLILYVCNAATELSGLLGEKWETHEYKDAFNRRVRAATTMQEVKDALLELEAALQDKAVIGAWRQPEVDPSLGKGVIRSGSATLTGSGKVQEQMLPARLLKDIPDRRRVPTEARPAPQTPGHVDGADHAKMDDAEGPLPADVTTSAKVEDSGAAGEVGAMPGPSLPPVPSPATSTQRPGRTPSQEPVGTQLHTPARTSQTGRRVEAATPVEGDERNETYLPSVSRPVVGATADGAPVIAALAAVGPVREQAPPSWGGANEKLPYTAERVQEMREDLCAYLRTLRPADATLITREISRDFLVILGVTKPSWKRDTVVEQLSTIIRAARVGKSPVVSAAEIYPDAHDVGSPMNDLARVRYMRTARNVQPTRPGRSRRDSQSPAGSYIGARGYVCKTKPRGPHAQNWIDESSILDDSAKRSRRQTQPSDVATAAPSKPTPAKRGRGRPRKNPSAEIDGQSLTVRRGPGRPRKSDSAPIVITADGTLQGVAKAKESGGSDAEAEEDVDPVQEGYLSRRRMVAFWWAGSWVHRQASGTHHLPVSMARKAARQGGVKPIAGVMYKRKGGIRPQRVAWRARVQESRTWAQLAGAVRRFDEVVRWADVRTPPGQSNSCPLLDRKAAPPGEKGYMYMVRVLKEVKKRDSSRPIADTTTVQEASGVEVAAVAAAADAKGKAPASAGDMDIDEQTGMQASHAWVHESVLPLWQIRVYEERARAAAGSGTREPVALYDLTPGLVGLGVEIHTPPGDNWAVAQVGRVDDDGSLLLDFHTGGSEVVSAADVRSLIEGEALTFRKGRSAATCRYRIHKMEKRHKEAKRLAAEKLAKQKVEAAKRTVVPAIPECVSKEAIVKLLGSLKSIDLAEAEATTGDASKGRVALQVLEVEPRSQSATTLNQLCAEACEKAGVPAPPAFSIEALDARKLEIQQAVDRAMARRRRAPEFTEEGVLVPFDNPEPEEEDDYAEEDFEEELEKPKRKRHRSSARGYEEYAEDMSLDPDEFAPPDPDEFTEESQRTAKALLGELRDLEDADGRKIFKLFERLPTSKQLPIYYRTIARPIDYHSIVAGIRSAAYGAISEYVADVETMWANCMVFNAEGSGLFEDAVFLRDHFRQRLAEYFPHVDPAVCLGRVLDLYVDPPKAIVAASKEPPADQPKPKPKPKLMAAQASNKRGRGPGGEPAPKKSRSGARRSGKRKPRLSVADPSGAATGGKGEGKLPAPVAVPTVSELCGEIMGDLRETMSNGRLVAELFIKLPTKREFPAYYNVIAQPMDFVVIDKRIKKGEYATLQDLESDVSLMFDNAQTFNQDGSEIYKDATKLRRRFASLLEGATTKLAAAEKAAASVSSHGARLRALLEPLAKAAVGRKVQVYWEEDGTWYEAEIVAARPSKGEWDLSYPLDGDAETLDANSPECPQVRLIELPSGGASLIGHLGLDPMSSAVGAKVEVMYTDDDSWYEATVESGSKNGIVVVYEYDGSKEKLTLKDAERVRLVRAPSRAGKTPSAARRAKEPAVHASELPPGAKALHDLIKTYGKARLVGSTVEVEWDDDEWYEGVVLFVEGSNTRAVMSVEYEDATREELRVSDPKCRKVRVGAEEKQRLNELKQQQVGG